MIPSSLYPPSSKTALELFQEKLAVEPSAKLLLLQPLKTTISDSDDPKDIYEQNDIGKEKQPSWLELPGSGIHELYGVSGTGKTQIALDLCIHAAASGLRDDRIRCVYLCLHGNNFLGRAAQRLSQMASKFTRCRNFSEIENIQNVHIENGSLSNHHILQRILLRGCINTDDLFNMLETDLPVLLRQPLNCVQLLVIDSISDLFRGRIDCIEASGSTCSEVAAQRASMLFRLTTILKSLSDRFQPLTILTINQATADFSKVAGSGGQSIKPALGLSWSYCVNSRYMLSKDGSNRTITLVKSSRFHTETSIPFIIRTEGCFLSIT